MKIHANYYTQVIGEKETRSTKKEDILEAGYNPLAVDSVVIDTRTYHGTYKNKEVFEALKSSIVIFVWKGGKVERSWKTTGKYK